MVPTNCARLPVVADHFLRDQYFRKKHLPIIRSTDVRLVAYFWTKVPVKERMNRVPIRRVPVDVYPVPRGTVKMLHGHGPPKRKADPSLTPTLSECKR